jgi:hypothetical protein
LLIFPKVGDLGTIVECYGHPNNLSAEPVAYEVEFANADGETIALQTLEPAQFVVAWQNATKAWVPLAERVAALLQTLPEDRQAQVIEFARTLA